MTGAQLAHDKIDRYRSLGAFGKPVYQSHVQLQAMLRSKLGERAARYFAKPTVDPDLGELRWTAEVPGAVRGWHELSGEEQAARALDLEVLRSQLMGYAGELRRQSAGQPGGAASFASLLEQATRVPAQGNFLYFVGEQPVIAFWGFEDPDGGSVDPSTTAPRFTPPVAAEPLAPPVAPEPVSPPGVPQRGRPWWWWLLGLLLALLLLGLLFWLLRGCTPTLAVPAGANPAASAPAETPASVPLPADRPAALPGASAPEAPASGPGFTLSPGGPGPSSEGPGALPGAWPGASAALPSVESPRDPAAVPGTLPVPDSSASAAGLPRTEPPLSARDPLARPGEPTLPPPLPPADQRNLALPERAAPSGRMDFLEGDWRAGDGLVDRSTQQPLDLSLRFGPKGQGEILLRRPDGTTCRGPVQGRLDGGKLSIQGNQAVPCSNGGQYGAPRIECARERGGQTQCYGVNSDGSRYAMGMERSK